jgi:pimeloyl-ACP methyl ester carboxylesterase
MNKPILQVRATTLALLGLATLMTVAAQAALAQAAPAAAPPVRTATVDLADATIFYRYTGQGSTGRPVLFVHALLIDSRLWLDQLDGLCAARRCLAPDFSGFGFSSPLRGDKVDQQAYADELLEFLDRVGVKGPVDVVALSAGGNIAAAAYLKNPARFRSMVLISTGFGAGVLDAATARYRAENARNVVIEGKDALFRRFNEYIVAPQASLMARARYKTMIEQTSYESLVAFFNTTEFGGSPSLPGALRLPVMVPVGRGDSVLTVQGAEKLVSQLPDARVVRIESAGRLLPLESPAELNAAVNQFWNELDARGSTK